MWYAMFLVCLLRAQWHSCCYFSFLIFFFFFNQSCSTSSPPVYEISQCQQWCWLGMLMGYKELNSVWQLRLVYKVYTPNLCILQGFNCRYTFISCQKCSLKIIKIPEVNQKEICKHLWIYLSVLLVSFFCTKKLRYSYANLKEILRWELR